MLRDIIGFAENQQLGTYGLGYNMTLTGNSINFVLNKANATNIGKIRINAIEWYIPHHTPSISQQA